MANLVITSDEIRVYVEFNVYSGADFPTKSSFDRRDILEIHQWDDPTINALEIKMLSGSTWYVSNSSTPNGLVIDLVNGIAPTSLEDLKDKIDALMI